MDEPNTPDTPVDDAADLSLAEHEAQFNQDTRGSGPPEPEGEPGEPEVDAPKLPRERDESGKFVEKAPPRHRAKSQHATAADVPRINKLTAELRQAQEERDAIRAERDAFIAERAQARSTSTVPPVVRPASEPPALPATASEKPKIDSFQEYSDYVEALADWKIAEARRHDRETAQRDAEATRVTESWKSRVNDARARYPDFEQVALVAPTSIPPGSVIDAWILEDTTGADVLYHLQKDPGELRRILALPLFEQVKALSLLAQRLSPTREPAVRTGAAATTPRAPAPRPPTPVRTSAVSVPDEAPDPESASLAEFERFYHRRRE